jgi:hypothetical protein
MPIAQLCILYGTYNDKIISKIYRVILTALCTPIQIDIKTPSLQIQLTSNGIC